jgi:hypothetical protein
MSMTDSGSGRKLADHHKLRDIDDLDHVVVPASNVKLLMGRVEMHVAWPPRRLDVFDDLISLRIENDDVVRFLVADKNEAGILGGAWRQGDDKRNRQRQAQSTKVHGSHSSRYQQGPHGTPG